MTRESTGELNRDDRRILLGIARTVLEHFVRNGETLDPERFALTDAVKMKRGAFVTLRIGEVLRGCIGFTSNTKPLVQTVCDSVIRSATHDPRFPPVSADELAEMRIEISALGEGDRPDTPFIHVERPDEFVIGRDGAYVEWEDGRGALLLPQVAEERGWKVEQFLAALCAKAGKPPGAWRQPSAQLFRFTAQVFDEDRFPTYPQG